jgi:hypothetical protein
MSQIKLISQYLHLHFIVVLLGFTAILGALITMDAVALVWWRMLLASAGLLIFLYFKKIPMVVSWKQLAHLLSIGVLVALHWITFFSRYKCFQCFGYTGCICIHYFVYQLSGTHSPKKENLLAGSFYRNCNNWRDLSDFSV